MKKKWWLQSATSLSLAALLLAGTLSFAQETQDKAQELYKQGRSAYSAGKLDEAIQYFKQAAQANPGYNDAFFNLGVSYYQKKDYANAVQAFNNVLQLNPNDHQARFSLGVVYQLAGQNEKAKSAFELIPIASSRYEEAQKHLAELKQGTKPAEQTAQKPATTPTTTTPAATRQPAVMATNPEAGRKPASQPAASKPMASATTAQTVTQPSGVSVDFTAPPPADSFKVQELADGFFGPTGLVIGRDGNLYVANFSKNSIYKVNNKGEKTLFASGTGLSGPVGMTSDPLTGDLFVANHLANTVSKISPDGKIVVIAKDLKKPYNIFFHEPTRTLYVSEQETNSIAKIKLN